MTETDGLFVSPDKTILVRVCPEGDGLYVEVATRPEPGATWGPPIEVVREGPAYG